MFLILNNFIFNGFQCLIKKYGAPGALKFALQTMVIYLLKNLEELKYVKVKSHLRVLTVNFLMDHSNKVIETEKF